MASNLLMNYGIRMRMIAGQLQSFTGHHANRLITANVNYRNYSATTNDDASKNMQPNRFDKCAIGTATKKQPKPPVSIKSIPDALIKKSVFISQSHDIFTNLALEDWFYRNSDFANHHALLLWSNDPCVVIGCHQNPFGEANIAHLQEAGIAVARRGSGGGTVYHDRGNLNLTFFTPRERYNRNYNLNIVTRALFREWGIKAETSSNDYVLVNEKKVSNYHS